MRYRRRLHHINNNISASFEAMKKIYNRTLLAGGVTVDFSANTENIRDISRDLGFVDVISAATFVYVPSSYSEDKVFTVDPNATNSDFTFTRSTISTTLNKDGYIADSCYNLFSNSEDFSQSSWILTETTISTDVTTNYLGQMTADKIIPSTNSGNHSIRVNLPSALPSAQLVYNSIYCKAAGYNRIRIGVNVNATRAVNFDLTAGTITSTIGGNTGIITPVGDGWYRCTSIGTATTVFDTYVLNDAGTSSFVGDGTSGIYIWGAQTTIGTVDKPYFRTTDRLDVPTLDYSLTSIKGSWLLEPQRTNLLGFSETFSQATWAKTQLTVSANTNSNPFGVNKSYYLYETSVGASRNINQSRVTTSGLVYTMSYFVKKADSDWIQIAGGAVAYPNTWVNFNLNTGLFGNSGSSTTAIYSKQSLPNGWWKISWTDMATATGNNPNCVIFGCNNTNTAVRQPSYVGNTSTRLVDYAGAQFELSSYPTSYIPNLSAAQTTRNGDNAYVDLNMGNLLPSSSAFTLFVEGYLVNGAGTNLSIGLSDTTATGARVNDIGFFDGIKASWTDSTVTTADTSSLSANSYFKVAIQRSGTSVKFFRNGSQIWTTQTVPEVAYQYLVVNNGGSTFSIDKIALFPTTLSDSVCVNLTI